MKAYDALPLIVHAFLTSHLHVIVVCSGQGQRRAEQPGSAHLPHANGQVAARELDAVPREIRQWQHFRVSVRVKV